MYCKVLYIFPVCSGFPSRLFCTFSTTSFACSSVVSPHLIFSTSSGASRFLSSSAVRWRISSGLRVCGRAVGVGCFWARVGGVAAGCLVGSACGYGVFASASGFLPEEKVGAGDGDLDLCLELWMERCWPMSRTRAVAQSRILFLPDRPSLPLDIL